MDCSHIPNGVWLLLAWAAWSILSALLKRSQRRKLEQAEREDELRPRQPEPEALEPAYDTSKLPEAMRRYLESLGLEIEPEPPAQADHGAQRQPQPAPPRRSWDEATDEGEAARGPREQRGGYESADRSYEGLTYEAPEAESRAYEAARSGYEAADRSYEQTYEAPDLEARAYQAARAAYEATERSFASAAPKARAAAVAEKAAEVPRGTLPAEPGLFIGRAAAEVELGSAQARASVVRDAFILRELLTPPKQYPPRALRATRGGPGSVVR